MITLALAFASSLLVLADHASFAAAFAATPSHASPPPSLLPSSSAAAVATAAPGRRTCSTSLSAVREATFGMGCFWEPAESLLKEKGILATTVGYTGAPPNKPAPTYDSVCFGRDWVEAVRVAYDDDQVSYDQLLDHFFRLQKPAYSRQYASIIFVDDAAEEKEAKKWLRESASSGKKERDDNITYDIVEIESSSPFFKAEEYHQRYWEKQRLKFLIGFALIAGESGAYNNFFEGALGSLDIFGFSFESACGAVFLAGAAWTILERLIARDVRELKQGDLIAMVNK
eukprot:CAMPEP_0183735678 /NCGR_PEP_ID=MMETSP0737-20130205/47375_1 /TAXON_ID=385413 /ORGANISM="Thalassiosira miniscula, Strain CCMP1093" /LENGTH=285 /DNA_ID=CAMNT_0025969499 /DNA_START=19 /DNA_END=876 /DNA_ORIENTATION=-